MPVFYIRHPSNVNRCRIYEVNANGNIFIAIVTANPDVAAGWVQDTFNFNRHSRVTVVGIAIQNSLVGLLDPRPGDTVQLCVGPHCLIFQLSRASHVPVELREFLLNDRFIFVSFWDYDSIRNMLLSSRPALRLGRNYLNVRDYMINAVAQETLERIVGACCGLRLSGDVIWSDWGREILSEDQVVHASIIPHCAFLIAISHRLWRLF